MYFIIELSRLLKIVRTPGCNVLNVKKISSENKTFGFMMTPRYGLKLNRFETKTYACDVNTFKRFENAGKPFFEN